MSLASAVKGAHEKSKSGKVVSMTMEPAVGGKHYIVTHHTEGYDHPSNNAKHVVTKGKLSTHCSEHMPLSGKDEDDE